MRHQGENPNCTDWCRGPGHDSRGHYPVSEADLARLKATAAVLLGGSPDQASEEQLQGAVEPLYNLDSWGYHAIADALGKSHEWAFLVITRQI